MGQLQEYKNEQEKQNVFDYKKVDTADELKKVIEEIKDKIAKYKNDIESERFQKLRETLKNNLGQEFAEELVRRQENPLIFRGINNARFKMYTSAQRMHILNDINTTIEKFIVDELAGIKNNNLLLRYYPTICIEPKKLSDLYFLTFLQHFGGATSLLDFTYDFKTALFFALDGIAYVKDSGGLNEYFSLYYIDKTEQGMDWPDLLKITETGIKKGKEMAEELQKTRGVYVDKGVIENPCEIWKWDNSVGDGISAWSLFFVENPEIATKYGKKHILSANGQPLLWSNINVIAQKWCSLNYYDRNNPYAPLEDYFNRNNTFNFNRMHCIDIHKSLIGDVRIMNLPSNEEVYPDYYKICKKLTIKQ